MAISKTNISDKNLNLLVILAAILEAKSMTEAAKRLRMSQPNLSRALKLLREEFGDPLFVRTPQGFSATKRALDLSVQLREALKILEGIYVPSIFDIRDCVGRFTIGTTDFIEFLLAPLLSENIEREAPGITLNFRPSHGVLPKEQLEKGEFDLAIIIPRETIPPNFFRQHLFRDPYVCAVRKDHPILRSRITLTSFTKYGHTMINPQGTLWAITDDLLSERKLSRRVVMGTPNCLSAVAAVSKSNLILTATKGFLQQAAEFFPMEIFKSPFEIAPIDVYLVWHERTKKDPLNLWMRQRVKAHAADLSAFSMRH